MEMEDKSILVGQDDKEVLIKIIGEGTIHNSHTLKEFLNQMIKEGYKDFIICLEECLSVDSTFIGVLVGIGLKLKKKFNRTLRLVNVSAHNRKPLKTLGVIGLFDVIEDWRETFEELKYLERKRTTKLQAAEHIMRAHEHLMELDVANRIKFKDVHKFMAQEIAKMKEKT